MQNKDLWYNKIFQINVIENCITGYIAIQKLVVWLWKETRSNTCEHWKTNVYTIFCLACCLVGFSMCWLEWTLFNSEVNF